MAIVFGCCTLKMKYSFVPNANRTENEAPEEQGIEFRLRHTQREQDKDRTTAATQFGDRASETKQTTEI